MLIERVQLTLNECRCTSVEGLHWGGTKPERPSARSDICSAIEWRFRMSVGGANGPGGAGGVGGSKGAGESGSVGDAGKSAASDSSTSAAVDGAMDGVTDADVAGVAASVTDSVDGFDSKSTDSKAEAEAKAEEAKENQVAGICIGTHSECAQKAAEGMTKEEAIEALDRGFFHDPRSLTPSQVKGLEALTEAPHLSERARDSIRGFLNDHYNGVDSLGINGQLGRPDAPKTVPSGSITF